MIFYGGIFMKKLTERLKELSRVCCTDEQELIDLMKGKMDIESAMALIQQRKAQTAKIYSQI